MDDLISRQEAISLEVMPKKYRKYQTYNLDDAYEQGWFDLQKCIEKLPSAQPEQKRGRWIETNNPNYSPFDSSEPYNAICSKCFYTSTQKFNYCPNCGSRMDMKEE